ncbi:MAG: hypothetical protein JW749_08910 [Sedimentisphaerales bacterium]|nr:hypothetical protein [Sedimentisphaerales bacterium]
MDCEKQAGQIPENLLFANIFRSFRMAIGPGKLIIALGLIAGIGFVGWSLDKVTKSVVTTPGSNGRETELDLFLNAPHRLESYIQKYAPAGQGRGVFSTMWAFGIEKFHGSLKNLFELNLPGILYNVTQYLTAMEWAFKHHYLYCAVFGLINLCLISIAGGAICRIAALQFSRDEKPGISEALRYSINKFVSFFTAPVFPAGFVIGVIGLIALLGLLANIPFGAGELITGILTPAALVGGAVAAFVLIGAIAGFNLVFPAIAYDGLDSLDAVSRSFHYIYVRPWRMGIYTAAGVIYGAICYLFVRFFAFLLLWTTYTGLRIGACLDSKQGLADKIMAIWPEPSFSRLTLYSTSAGSLPEKAGAFLVYLFTLIVVGLVVSFIISFYYSANTVIYALLRNKVEDMPFDEIYTPLEEANLPQKGA